MEFDRTQDARALPDRPVVAVVGATGLVGETLLTVLAEREFPVGALVLLASEGSIGRRIAFGGTEVAVRRTEPAAFDGVDLVFFAATGALSRTLAPEAVRRGARVIDKSASWRLAPDVPLVVPEINGALLDAGAALVACPNCTTIGLVMALEPIRRAAGLRRVVVTTMQAASGAGSAGSDALAREERAVFAGAECVASDTFGAVLARNVIPVCDRLEADGASTEERKLVLETRKILGLADLELAATCARVPVPIGHSASVWLETETPLSPAAAEAALDAFPGVRVAPAPTAADVAGSDDVLVGRVRRGLDGVGLQFWQVADNLRKGAATNAVQIAARLLAQGG